MSRGKHFKRGTGEIKTCTNCGDDIVGSDKATKSRTYKGLGETTWQDKSGNDVYTQYHSHNESDFRGRPVFEAGPHCKNCSADRQEVDEQNSQLWANQEMRNTSDWNQ